MHGSACLIFALGVCAGSGGALPEEVAPTAFGYEASTLYHPKSPHSVFDPDQVECEEKNDDGRHKWPLHIAAKALVDSPHNIRIMVKHLKNNVNGRAFKCGTGVGVTPLMVAAARGNVKVVQELIDLGADLTLVDGKGNTAEKIAEYWMQEASDMDRADRCGQIWQYLYEQNGGLYANDGRATGRSNHSPRIQIFDAAATQCPDLSPLHVAAIRDEDLRIRGMVRNLGYVVDRRGFKCGGTGVTPLMVAASKGSPNAARELLAQGADATLVDDHGNDAAMIADYWSGDGDQDRAEGCQQVVTVLRDFAKPAPEEYGELHAKPVSIHAAQNATDIMDAHNDVVQVATAPDFEESSVSEVTVKTGKHGNGIFDPML